MNILVASICFLIGVVVGGIFGVIKAIIKIRSLQKAITENEQHAENYLKWLHDTVIKDVKVELQEIKTKMGKEK